MKTKLCDIGVIGLGRMGSNLILNISEKGFPVAGFDKDTKKIKDFEKTSKGYTVCISKNIRGFIELLKKPRNIILLVPSGLVVDSVIKDILPYLRRGDLVIDVGNSHFRDTDRRSRELKNKGIYFLGVGISGGKKGARYGPSIMPGGESVPYRRIKSIFEAIAAKVNNEPCVTHLGAGSAGHYVKMVHNGIEYGLMQVISETYDILRRGVGLTNDELHDVYSKWNQIELKSFLIKITAQIFRKFDDYTNVRLIDMISDKAEQKGTGKWVSQDAMDLQIPVPNIDIAVMMRNLSGLKDERTEASHILHSNIHKIKEDRKTFIQKLQNAFYFAMIVTYAQGMHLLKRASKTYHYGIDLKDVARIWRGGCIISSSLLDDILSAFQRNPELPNLMVDPDLSIELIKRQVDIREVVYIAVKYGIPVPCLSTSIAYFDSYRSIWLPLNLIQAQRDYFGGHGYKRIDKKGTFHTQWDTT